jgi:hypothetical protein
MHAVHRGYILSGFSDICFYFRKMHEDPEERAPPLLLGDFRARCTGERFVQT